MKTNFKWDDSALDRDSVTITLNEKQVTFTELSRKDTLAFIKDSSAIKMRQPSVKDGAPVLDEEGKQVEELLPLEDRYVAHQDMIFDTLAKMSGGAMKAKEFDALNMGLAGLTQFVDMIYQINHVDEILQTQGNLLLLPWAQKKSEA